MSPAMPAEVESSTRVFYFVARACALVSPRKRRCQPRWQRQMRRGRARGIRLDAARWWRRYTKIGATADNCDRACGVRLDVAQQRQGHPKMRAPGSCRCHRPTWLLYFFQKERQLKTFFRCHRQTAMMLKKLNAGFDWLKKDDQRKCPRSLHYPCDW